MRKTSIILAILFIILCQSLIFGRDLNPYAGEIVTLKYWISKYAVINAKVEDSKGKIIRNIIESELINPVDEGSSYQHYVSWDGRDNNNNIVANNKYYVKIIAKARDSGEEKSVSEEINILSDGYKVENNKLLVLDGAEEKVVNNIKYQNIGINDGYIWETKAEGKYYEPLNLKYVI